MGPVLVASDLSSGTCSSLVCANSIWVSVFFLYNVDYSSHYEIHYKVCIFDYVHCACG